MARPVVLGNGSLSVGLNTHGMVHDFYYPHVGLENHDSERNMHHRIGVWVDGTFSWLDDGSWDIKLEYSATSVIGIMTAKNEAMQLVIESRDFVDSQLDVFARNLHIINNSDQKREIRVFWHQVFQISSSYSGDTVQYRPAEGVISHYKGLRAFAIYAENSKGEIFDQHAVGLCDGEEGHLGTYVDAEDGELGGNAVEHGMVDSVIRVVSNIGPHSSDRQYYWIAAANRPHNAIALHNVFKEAGLFARYQFTVAEHRKLIEKTSSVADLLPADYQKILRQSVGIIFTQIDNNGSVIASSDSSVLNYGRDYYAYCWPRDAVYILHPLLLMGYKKPLKHFFNFVEQVIHYNGYMMHKYRADGAIGSSWHPYINNGKPELPIQEDETAGVLWLLGQYWRHTKDDEILTKYYDKLVKPMANFMVEYIDSETNLPHASYDLWEEKFLTSTYTVSVVVAAFNEAADMAEAYNQPEDARSWKMMAGRIQEQAVKVFWNEEKQFFYKGYLLQDDGTKKFDDTIDSSSLFGAFTYKLWPRKSEIMSKAVKTAEDKLYNKSGVGGFIRYEDDYYWRHDDGVSGNPWLITTLWMAHYYLHEGEQTRAKDLIDWVVDKAMSTGVLPEQLHAKSGGFAGVAPLNWSHAELVNTLILYKALGL